MDQWQVGGVRITRIVEMEVSGGTRFILPDATRDACLPMGWQAPHFMDGEGNLVMSFHALTDMLVIGTHFATPTAGHVRRLEVGGYWLDVG